MYIYPSLLRTQKYRCGSLLVDEGFAVPDSLSPEGFILGDGSVVKYTSPVRGGPRVVEHTTDKALLHVVSGPNSIVDAGSATSRLVYAKLGTGSKCELIGPASDLSDFYGYPYISPKIFIQGGDFCNILVRNNVQDLACLKIPSVSFIGNTFKLEIAINGLCSLYAYLDAFEGPVRVLVDGEEVPTRVQPGWFNVHLTMRDYDSVCKQLRKSQWENKTKKKARGEFDGKARVCS